MANVAMPTEAGCAALVELSALAGGDDLCWNGDFNHRDVFAAYRGEPIRGNVLRTCNNPKCLNPRHLRLARELPPISVTPDMWRESDGCHLWKGLFVSKIPMLRFTQKNVNVPHFVAERDLQDYRDLRDSRIGTKRGAWPWTPIVTKMCGRHDCINSAHFLVSPEIIVNRGGLDRLRDDLHYKGPGFWAVPAVGNRGISRDSVNRWRRFYGLEEFQQF